jgi:hypothetical protein
MTPEEARSVASAYAAGMENGSKIKTAPKPDSHRGTEFGWLDFGDAYARAISMRVMPMPGYVYAYEIWQKSAGRTISEDDLQGETS